MRVPLRYPLGLIVSCIGIEDTVTVDNCSVDPSEGTFVDMGTATGGSIANRGQGGGPDISNTWQKTFPCRESATQLMSAVQNDMGKFATNGASLFPDFPLRKGQSYNIDTPIKTLHVTVTAQTPNAWVFTTDPAHHFFNGTVMFIATNAGNGNVIFSITASANWASKATQYTIGPLVKMGENSAWNNLLNNVQGYCTGGRSQ